MFSRSFISFSNNLHESCSNRDAAQIQADAQVKAADIAAEAQLEAQRLALQAAQAQAAANAARSYSGGGGGAVTIKSSTPPKSGTSGTTRKVNPGTPYTPPYKTSSANTYRGYAPYASQVHSNTKPTAYAGVTAAVNKMLSDSNKKSRAQSRR